MIWTVLFLLIMLPGNCVLCVDLNSVQGRFNCYPTEQLNCSQDFIDAYPHLSKSATNLTDADTFFWLFTRRNSENPEKLHKCAGRLPPNTQFDPTQKLIVIIPAFGAGICNIAVYREWISQMLQRGNYNVIAVDYTWGNNQDYATALINMKIVAKQTVIVLKNIQERMKIKNRAITLVGNSLGAQIAGLIGNEIHVGKITGLDPAGPGFDVKKVPRKDRLDRSDADLVEVWHCNMGDCPGALGTPYDVGHLNYYINGGKVQRSCYRNSLISFLKGDLLYAYVTATSSEDCYHIHCTQYYKVSINPGNCKFLGVKCRSYDKFNEGKCKCGRRGENCLVMGFDTEKYIKGKVRSPQKYFLNTTDKCPYCDNSPSYKGGFCDTYA